MYAPMAYFVTIFVYCLLCPLAALAKTSCVTQHVKMGYKSHNQLIEHVFVKIISLFMSLFWSYVSWWEANHLFHLALQNNNCSYI